MDFLASGIGTTRGAEPVCRLHTRLVRFAIGPSATQRIAQSSCAADRRPDKRDTGVYLLHHASERTSSRARGFNHEARILLASTFRASLLDPHRCASEAAYRRLPIEKSRSDNRLSNAAPPCRRSCAGYRKICSRCSGEDRCARCLASVCRRTGYVRTRRENMTLRRR